MLILTALSEECLPEKLVSENNFMPKKSIRKCYFTEIDDQFDPKRDIAIGPWCFLTVEDAEGVSFIEPYEKDEILLWHRKLFDLSFFLLNRDLEKCSTELRDKHYLFFQKEYVTFVFFAFSRYRSVKKMLEICDINTTLFEEVQNREIPNCYSYFKTKTAGYLSYKILCYISKDLNLNVFNKNDESTYVQAENIRSLERTENKTKLKIKKYMNYFHNLNGVRFFKGFFLTLLYQLANLTKINKCSVYIYSPEIKFDDEVSEFIKIFDHLSDFFIEKKIGNTKTKVKIPKLSIRNPGFFYERDNALSQIDSLLEGESKLIIYQHGAYYATVKKHFHRELEYNMGTFLSWGIQNESYLKRENIINNLPYPYLSSLANKYKFKQQKNILWVTGVHYRAGDGLEYLNGQSSIEYMKKKLKFYEDLHVSKRDVLLYKTLLPNAEMFPDSVKNILPTKSQVLDQNIVSLMLNSKVIFLDFYGTSFYEAMSMNVPVIMGLFESNLFFTSQAKTVFDRFETVGVIQKDPEKSANFINQLDLLELKTWWNQDEIQSVRKDFLKMYANNKNYFFPWCKAILKGTI